MDELSDLELGFKRMDVSIEGIGISFALNFREKNPYEKFLKIDLEYNGKKYKFHTDWDFENGLDLDFTFNYG